MSEEMNDQMLVRREKLQELRDLGIDPFGQKFVRSGDSVTLHKEWDEFTKEEHGLKANILLNNFTWK